MALPSTRSSLREQLWANAAAYKTPFLVGALFLLATQILTLRIPRELGQAIQVLKTGGEPDAVQAQVISHCVTIILLALGACVMRILSRIKIFNAGRSIEYDLRNQVFSHLADLSPRYYQSIPTGDLTSRVINDTTYVRLLYGLGVLHGTNTLFAYVLAVGAMVKLDWQLAALCLVPYPFLLFLVQRLARALHVQTKIVQERLADLSSQVQEDLSGMAVLKAYCAEEVEAGRFSDNCERYVHANLKLVKIRGVLMPLMMSVGALGGLLVLFFGGRAVIQTGSITLGEFIEFSGYLALLTWPTLALGWVISVWQRGTAAFERLVDVIGSPVDISGPESDGGWSTQGAIEFRNVSFRFDDDSPEVLRNLSFRLEAGTKVGIVGRSGSGKTTLVNLIARYHDPTDGTIEIDSKPLPQIPLQDLRSALGYAPQEPFLFSTTVAKNISMGYDVRHPDAPEPERSDHLGWAVATSQIGRDLDALPQGLDTMVGERGITLSGGQKQRVALARALMTKPSILILDDSLASVDSQTERLILDELDVAMRGRTALVVTHRFNVLELMDEILVLDRGRLVERGTHDQLVKSGGHYAQMVERQRLKEELSSL